MREPYEETRGENLVRLELDKMGIKYNAQFPFRNGFIVDFAIPDHKIILEVDIHPSHFTVKGKKKGRFRDWMFGRSVGKIVHMIEKDLEDIPGFLLNLQLGTNKKNTGEL